MLKSLSNLEKNIILVITISALGYFVDAYELWVAALCRGASIIDLKIESENFAMSLENFQNVGLLLGSFFGIMADRFGRIKALYTSIFVYSLANIANAFIVNNSFYNIETTYMVLRLISGIGLGAELGVAISLVSESMKKENRGYGNMFVIAFGLLGTVFAATLNLYLKPEPSTTDTLFLFSKDFSGYWRIMYFTGGVMGLLLLIFRLKTKESIIYVNNKEKHNTLVNLKSIFSKQVYMKKFILGILLGAPAYFVITLPIKFFTEFTSLKGLNLSTIIIVFFVALSIGDIISNYISQKVKSRKKVITGFLLFTLFSLIAFYLIPPKQVWQYEYVYMSLFGLGLGFWVLLNTTIAEMWPTELRATMSTTIPNFIRALPLLFLSLIQIGMKNHGAFEVTAMIGIPLTVIAIIASFLIPETFNNDLKKV